MTPDQRDIIRNATGTLLRVVATMEALEKRIDDLEHLIDRTGRTLAPNYIGVSFEEDLITLAKTAVEKKQ